MAKRYQVSDGKMVLTLQRESNGWFVVTSPTDPAMITQARTIEEAFDMARDAFGLLATSRGDAGRWKRPRRRAVAAV
jgi:predicted RNase H-like HicB family nuclease